MTDHDELIRRVFDSENGLSWEQRLDFFLKAVNDVSKALNEAAQSSKFLHRALGDHNELLSNVFYLIAHHFYSGSTEDDDNGRVRQFLNDVREARMKEKHGKTEGSIKVSE